jgi:dihydroorotase
MTPTARTRKSPARARREGPTPATVVCGRALVGGTLQPLEVGMDEEGRILRVGRSVPGGSRKDFGDLVLLPSATDLHVHFREPGRHDEVEDLAKGTMQAAFGGVGLVADMPNNLPIIDSLDRLRDKIARASRRLAVDLLLYAAARPGAAFDRLATEAGGFKLFLSPSTGTDDVPTDFEVRELVSSVARTGLPLSVHAEDPMTFRAVDSIRGPPDWDRSRPIEAERRAVDRILPPPGALRLNVAHVTDVASVHRLVESGQAFEATPHHLLLSSSAGADARWKVNPPLRSDGDRAALWNEFESGRIPFLASDHAPHPREAKELPFDRAPSGVPGVETALPLMLEQVRATELELSVLQMAACDRPARWLGVPMGRILPGHWANLAVVDFRARRTVQGRTLHGGGGWTPFEGWTGIFPKHHMLRGEMVVQDGEYVGSTAGRVVRPEYAPVSARPSRPALRS